MRFAIERLARQFPVTGFVENLEDGRVRMVAEGDPLGLEKFLDAIRVQAPGAIHRIEKFESPKTSEFSNFTIHR
jgi:acylphosphatase